jgi:starch-binding outer membrane protein, SusD/RagB family
MMKKIYSILFLAILASFSSCKKWLDVKPKTQIESGANFESQQGFKDALAGVYLNMATTNLYAQEMSWGLIDVLGKQYSLYNSGMTYVNTTEYNYQAPATVSRIANIWKGMYFSITNLNNLLEAIDKADASLFDGTNQNVIKGEALALRAFHHFDLLRVFAPAPVTGLNAAGIPYRDKVSTGNVKKYTVGEDLTAIQADLESAAALLKVSDPFVKGSTVPATTTGYLRDRQFKFNYYAVKALQARVFLYAGNTAKALECAREVIDSQVFPATAPSLIVGGNRIMSSEVIFHLFINTLQQSQTSFFTYQGSFATGLTKSTTEWSTVFEVSSGGSADYRYLYQTVQNASFRNYDKINPAVNGLAQNRLPLMRVSEMYYIAAECLKETAPGDAIGYLNTARQRRNLSPLSGTLTPALIQTEIFKEYQKEFLQEGQLFFYYKRLNLSRIEFTQVPGSAAVYVLPIPDDEIEYGNVK